MNKHLEGSKPNEQLRDQSGRLKIRQIASGTSLPPCNLHRPSPMMTSLLFRASDVSAACPFAAKPRANQSTKTPLGALSRQDNERTHGARSQRPAAITHTPQPSFN